MDKWISNMSDIINAFVDSDMCKTASVLIMEAVALNVLHSNLKIIIENSLLHFVSNDFISSDWNIDHRASLRTRNVER